MAMKKIYMTLPSSNSTFYVPFTEECRLIDAKAGLSTAQAGSGTINLGLSGATNWAMQVSADSDVSAGDVLAGAWNGSATEAEKKQVFDTDTPLEVQTSLNDTSLVVLELTVDPFVIGARTSLSS